jgi:hypothetical protein
VSVFFGERTSADDRGCFSSPRSGSSAPRHADARARVGEERDALFGIHGGRKPCWRVGSWRNGGREERGAQAKEGKKKVKSRAVKISSCFRSTSCSPYKKKKRCWLSMSTRAAAATSAEAATSAIEAARYALEPFGVELAPVCLGW